MRFNVLIYYFIVFSSCGQIPDPLRNKIEFTDNIYQVGDSILRVEELMKKLPGNRILSSGVDDQGFLWVNGKKLGPLEDAMFNSAFKNDSIFQNFNSEEFVQFISITKYLFRNHLRYSMRDNVSGLFVHGYRETQENSYDDMREILINVDTTSSNFVTRYQILDKKENVVLVAPIDAKVYR